MDGQGEDLGMRQLLVLMSVLWATSGSAAVSFDFECGRYQYRAADYEWMVVNTLIKGQMNLKDDQYTLKNWEGYYHLVDTDSSVNTPYTWAFASGRGDAISPVAHYRPRKYKDHIKLEIPFSDFGMSFGETDLIFPKLELVKGKENVAAYLVMTAIEDHFGATVPLDCRVGQISGLTSRRSMQPLTTTNDPDDQVKQCVEACQALFQPGPLLKSCVIDCYRR